MTDLRGSTTADSRSIGRSLRMESILNALRSSYLNERLFITHCVQYVQTHSQSAMTLLLYVPRWDMCYVCMCMCVQALTCGYISTHYRANINVMCYTYEYVYGAWIPKHTRTQAWTHARARVCTHDSSYHIFISMFCFWPLIHSRCQPRVIRKPAETIGKESYLDE